MQNLEINRILSIFYMAWFSISK